MYPRRGGARCRGRDLGEREAARPRIAQRSLPAASVQATTCTYLPRVQLVAHPRAVKELHSAPAQVVFWLVREPGDHEPCTIGSDQIVRPECLQLDAQCTTVRQTYASSQLPSQHTASPRRTGASRWQCLASLAHLPGGSEDQWQRGGAVPRPSSAARCRAWCGG